MSGESVEEGCRSHGISDKKTRELIDELNSYLPFHHHQLYLQKQKVGM